MRLLNASTKSLEEFADERTVPPYAILSHTWDEDEVTYWDITSNPDVKNKKGYSKLQSACNCAAAEEFSHIWIDTCCIDKSSSAELSEAINSMWRWYAQADICYAYLADFTGIRKLDSNALRADSTDPEEWAAHKDLTAFARSRWFRRGWTLQELLAPHHLVFFNQYWWPIGSLRNLATNVSQITGIERQVLLKNRSLAGTSMATRMSWAAHRSTTRPEDQAYSLLGIFNVNMPLLYGEGHRAFFRLQEEIIKSSSDHSIFAWNNNFAETAGHLLAWSPLNFLNGAQIVQDHDVTRDNSYSLTNSGLRVSLPVMPGEREGEVFALLNCRLRGNHTKLLALKLHRKGSWQRNDSETLFHVTTMWQGANMYSTSIDRPESRLASIDMTANIAALASLQKVGMTIARQPGLLPLSSIAWRVSKAWCQIDGSLSTGGLTVTDAYPREHWNAKTLFMTLPKTGSWKHQMDGGLLFSHPLLQNNTRLAVCFACKRSRICPAVLLVRRPGPSTLEDICSWLELERLHWFSERLTYLPDHGLIKLDDSHVLRFDMGPQNIVGETVLTIRLLAAEKVDDSLLTMWADYAEAVRSAIAAKMMFSLA